MNIFIIPGFKRKLLDRPVDDLNFVSVSEIARYFKMKPVPVLISWKFKTVSQYVDEFVEFYSKNSGKESIVIGNSFGAMIAMLSESRIDTRRIILCSLSAYFKEDLHKYSSAQLYKKVGTRRAKDLENHSAIQVATKCSTPVTYMYGEREKSEISKLYARVTECQNLTENSKLIEIPNALHRFRDEEYAAGIRDYFKEEFS